MEENPQGPVIARVVILVPAYRCESTIVETLESIQKQGPALSRIERVIVADDGSRDGTADLARASWHSPVPLQVMQRQFNCGEYASVNNAVGQFSEGVDWFLIMHADNIAKTGWLELFLDHLEKVSADVGIIGSSYDSFRANGAIEPGEDKAGIVSVPGTMQSLADTLKMGCWWHISASAIRVETYVRVGGLPKIMQLKGDWDFMLRVLADGWTMEHIPKSLMLYRDNPAGSSSISFRRHADIWETMSVIGRFRWAINVNSLALIHAQFMWYLLRRMAGCIVRVTPIRLLWVFPAMGCVFASFWTCVFDFSPKPEVTPRNLLQNFTSTTRES